MKTVLRIKCHVYKSHLIYTRWTRVRRARNRIGKKNMFTQFTIQRLLLLLLLLMEMEIVGCVRAYSTTVGRKKTGLANKEQAPRNSLPGKRRSTPYNQIESSPYLWRPPLAQPSHSSQPSLASSIRAYSFFRTNIRAWSAMCPRLSIGQHLNVLIIIIDLHHSYS